MQRDKLRRLRRFPVERQAEATCVFCAVQVGGTYSHEAAVAKPEEVYFKKGFETGAVSFQA